MRKRAQAVILILPAICLGAFLGFDLMTYAQTQPSSANPAPTTTGKGAAMTQHASGPFDVKVNPQTPDGKFEDATMGRMTIDKQFHGDLEGTSKGQMLTAMTDVKGSAGYVAIERVTGTLRTAQGVRSGTFMLQHTGTLTRGAPQLTVTVVPDSGTGQLAGLAGKMTINIVDGKHSYDFEYTLPETP
ncbi:MAG: DUF3224 domain-containing protein [Candidatus Sulfotelmatobacter sp.]